MASNRDSVPVDEDAVNSYVTSDSDLDEPLPSKAPGGRRRERTRPSLTIDRLFGVSFLKDDTEASVKEIGDDPDACMLWIISKIKERQFNEDLNRASIQLEQFKLDEEKRVKKLENEKLPQTEKFIAVFPTVRCLLFTPM
ncbi:hypothetical protein PsorP6_007823 [Peronosclerospora sorghi]|uniref:Uncharacterized protein n=1 Tax=Peronosclerospora sorghi TaxID=230839 RepID=A0ACC0W9V2_9STRA|nr:hypothetical protein PsorP6_007823 [Peronosclerospora sorghi]